MRALEPSNISADLFERSREHRLTLASNAANAFDRSTLTPWDCSSSSISDEQVAAARQAIATGSSLRAAATAIGCAPSTLWVRIKKAEAAEADARGRLGIRDRQPPQASGRRSASEPPASGALATAVEPAEVLRDAMQATKANGQPDWPN